MTQSGLGRALAKKTRVSIRSNGGDKSIRAEDISANSHNTGKTVGGKVKCEPSWVSFSKEELEFAEELPLWVKFPDSLSQFFSFPHPIDMINVSDYTHDLSDSHGFKVRIKGFLMFLLIALSLLLDATIDVPWVYIYVTVAYLCRALCGPRLDPPSWLTFYIIRPVVDFFFKAKPSYTAGPPKRFAQLCGFTMALVYCLVRMAGGYKEIANYIAGTSTLVYSQYWSQNRFPSNAHCAWGLFWDLWRVCYVCRLNAVQSDTSGALQLLSTSSRVFHPTHVFFRTRVSNAKFCLQTTMTRRISFRALRVEFQKQQMLVCSELELV